MFIATLIASEKLSGGEISAAMDVLRESGTDPCRQNWVEEGIACDLFFSSSPLEARKALEGLFPGVDVVVQNELERRKRLLVADMDSTMIGVECIDELADYAGLKEEISLVTEQAMRGEIDFETALIQRVELLAGLDELVMKHCHETRVWITPGAVSLVQTMKREKAYCLLVSGGFSFFADQIAKTIGFDRAVSNQLHVAGGKIKGSVGRPIIGAKAKRQALLDAVKELKISPDQALAIGDGANDILMLQSAGLGIAYHAKPLVAAAADARIEYCDLGAILYAQGYSRKEWEAA